MQGKQEVKQEQRGTGFAKGNREREMHSKARVYVGR